MATVKKTTERTAVLDRDRLISLYMDYVLEHENYPRTVYKFCKENDLEEEEFYQFFGSFEGLQKGVWERFYDHAVEVIEKSSEYPSFSDREKMLTFYYTFFEILTANRSYVLFALRSHGNSLKNLTQLKTLRKKVRGFAKDLMKEENEQKEGKILRNSETVFSEGAWLQLMFLLKFWMDDNSPGFESTDVAIEKSVNTVFDLFDTTPLERVLDLGKFLWKEKMV